MSVISGKEVDVPGVVKNILSSDENVLCGYQQAGLGGNAAGLESVFATDRRLIRVKPKTLGLRADIEDYQYRDMANVKMNKGIVRSSISIVMRFNSEPINIEKLPNDGTEKIFKIIQNGIAGVAEPGKTSGMPGPGASAQTNMTERLRQLKELKDSGLISEEEFQNKKTDILDKM
jgi:hypothetical protein